MKHKVLYFDCFAGASGDMIVGALLDLGLDQETFKGELAKLQLKGYKLKIQKVVKAGFSATKFDVMDEAGEQEYGNHHKLSPHRNLTEIVEIIENSDIATPIKVKSVAVFQKLARAEAKIHGTLPEEVHFHEVGAIDAIVDIVGAVTAMYLLEIDKIVVSPLPLGRGFVNCQHGVIPVPAPATLELLTGMPTYGSKHNGETVTPTGAAILATLCDAYGSMPQLNILKVGYGAGTRDFGVPNVLRAIIGWESHETLLAPTLSADSLVSFRMETIIGLEANIDDMNPEFYEYIMERLLAQGALDVFLVPIQMKKNRPAQMLRVLCEEKTLPEITKTLFIETSTIGLRFQTWQRYCLERTVKTVHTPYGEIRVKEAFWEGEIVNIAPEYDDCKKQAKAFRQPFKKVYQAAMGAATTGM